MRKEILDALKAKFTGVSDAILGRIADKLAKTATTAEQVATAVEGVTFQQVLESYGDSRATEAQQTAVSNYEKKHGLKDGKQVKGGASAEHNDEPDNQHGNGDNDIPAWAKAIIDGQKSLSDRLATIEGDKVPPAGNRNSMQSSASYRKTSASLMPARTSRASRTRSSTRFCPRSARRWRRLPRMQMRGALFSVVL